MVADREDRGENMSVSEGIKAGPAMRLWMDVYVASIRAGNINATAVDSARRAQKDWIAEFGENWDKEGSRNDPQ